MSLIKVPYEERPEGAVLLLEDDVLTKQRNLLNSYRPWTEVKFLKYGDFVLGATSCISGLFILRYFRKQFFLKHQGSFSSYLPTCMIPALGTQLTHRNVVTKSILTEGESCPLCLELRGIACQLGTGLIWPSILSPVASVIMAIRFRTHSVPPLTSDYKTYFQFMALKVKPGLHLLSRLTVINAALAAFVTYQEGKEYLMFRMRCQIRAELNHNYA